MSDPEPPGPNPYQPQQPPPAPQQQNPYYQQPQQPPPYQQPYGYQQPYQQPYPQAPYNYAPPAPAHPSANTAMILGIIGLAGIMACGGITLVLSPFAWAMGSKAVKEIDANPTVYGGRGSAHAGKVMGIIGTILLILGIVVVVGFIALAVATSSSSTTIDSNY